MKNVIFILLLIFSTSAFAELFTAVGTAPVVGGNVAQARNKAIEDALRQALLQSGAKISTNQSAKNGRLTIHNIRLSSDSQIKRYSVVKQEEKDGYIEVTVSAEIYNKQGVCRGKQYAKSITPILFFYDEGQADNSERQLHDINREITRQFHSHLLANKETFYTKPWLDRSYRIDMRSLEQEHNNIKEQIRHLAKVTDSQYLLLGSIRDLGFEEAEGNMFSKMFSDDNRNISFSVYLIDGQTGEMIFAKNYSEIAPWEFDKKEHVDVRSNHFWKSKYGKQISSLIVAAIAEISREAMCKGLQAYITRIQGNQYHINVGTDNNVKEGDVFYLSMTSNYYDTLKTQRLNSHDLPGAYVVKKVSTNNAILVPDSKTKADSNIQIGDIAMTK